MKNRLTDAVADPTFHLETRVLQKWIKLRKQRLSHTTLHPSDQVDLVSKEPVVWDRYVGTVLGSD